MTVSHSRSRTRRWGVCADAIPAHRAVSGGFTLIEVLLVLVILVTLASLAVTAYDGIRKRANINAAKAMIGLFEGQLELYQLSIKIYPTTDQGLEALRNPPNDLLNPDAWDGPYLKKPVPLDPWGKPYQYEYPGKNNPYSFDLWSFGPDMIDGTADDIGNWSQE
jgi:general secretion pathway protein G